MLLKYSLLICFFFNIASFAQSPGYLGKKFVAGYGFNFSPALFGSDASGNSIIGRSSGHATTGEFAFNVLHEGFVEYAVAKRFMMGFSAKFYKTTYDNSRTLSVTVSQKDQYGQIQSVSSYGSPEGIYYIKAQNYALYGKLFYSKYIAPWGRYMMFGVNVKTYTCSYNPNEMKINFNSYNYNSQSFTPYSNFGPQNQRFTKFDLLFGLGKTRIIYNRVTLDYGFNLNVIAVLSTVFDAVFETDGVFSVKTTSQNYMELTSPSRLRGVNRFNVFFKVGILLF